MDNSIGALRTELNAKLDALKVSLGVTETATLTSTQKNTISYGVDESNEAWNDTLGSRPH